MDNHHQTLLTGFTYTTCICNIHMEIKIALVTIKVYPMLEIFPHFR